MIKKELNNFVKIPNEMILGEKSLIKRYGDKSFLTYIYLQQNLTLRGKIHLSLGDLIKKSGYEQCRTKGKTNDQFKDILILFKKDNIIETDIDLSKVRVNDFIECTINNNLSKDFFTLTDFEIDVILNYCNNIAPISILKVYAAIKSRIYINKNNTSSVITGHYQVSFPSYKTISSDTGIKKEATIKECIDILVNDLKLLIVGNNGDRVKRITGEVKRDNNTYALNTDEGIESLKDALKFLKVKNEEYGWDYITAKDNRSLGGQKTQIKRKIKNGIATKKDLNKLEEIENTLNKDNYKSTMKDDKRDFEEKERLIEKSIMSLEDEEDFWG